MQNIVRKTIREFQPLLLILYLAIMGALCTIGVQAYIGEQPTFIVPTMFMCLVFAIYGLNRFTDLTEDFANNINTYAFFSKRKFIYKLAIAALIIVVIGLAAIEKLQLYHLILVSAGLLYSYRLVPCYSKGKGLSFCRLKELPLVKNLAVAALWGSAVFFIPCLFAGFPIADSAPLLLLIGVLCISTFNNTVFCDIRDETGDTLAQNKTLPVLIGIPATYAIMAITNVLWVLFALGMFVSGIYDVAHLTFVIIMAAYPLTYVVAHEYHTSSNTLVDFLCESDLMVFAGGLALLSIHA